MRKVIFWIHLTAGCVAGVVILIMSLTGVLLAYERQILEWSDSGFRNGTKSPEATWLPASEILASAHSTGGAEASAITLRSDPSVPAQVMLGPGRVLLVDPYSGQVLGEGSQSVRGFFRTVTDVHRWLGVAGPNRSTARTVTGVCNLAFFMLCITGIWIWLPRKMGVQHFKSVMLFRRGLSGKARDFNWHNVIGIWSVVPLLLVVGAGVVISFPWASDLVYKLAGSPVPGPRPGGPGPEGGRGARGGRRGGAASVEGIDEALAGARNAVPGWKTLTVRLPITSPNVTIAIEESHRGRADQKPQFAFNRRTGEGRLETFAEYNRGRQIRTWLRWIHTGEAGGVAGQTIAALASAGAVVLVWTGITLSLRRFSAWRARRAKNHAPEARQEAPQQV